MKKCMVLLLTLLFCFGLAACRDPGGSEDFDADIPLDTKATIYAAILTDASEEVMFNRAIVAFNRLYPNITVNLVKVPNYEATLPTKLRGGEDIDVVHVADNMVSFWAKNDLLYDLTPYIEASGFDESLYYPSMLNLGKSTHDGRQYVMTRDYSRIVTYFNRDLFDQYDVAYPEMGWSWEDFKSICAALKAKMPANYYAIDASMEYAILNYSILASFGVEGYLTENYDLIEDTTAMKQGLETAKEVVTMKWAPSPDGYKSGDFFKKVAAMTFDVRPAFSSFANPDQAIDFDVVNFPLINGKENAKIGAGSSGFGISKFTKRKNASWAFINFIMSEAGQEALTASGNAVPVLKSLAESEEAAWRSATNGKGKAVHNSAFTDYSDKDVISDYFGDLAPEMTMSFKGFWSNCCMQALTNKSTVDVALNKLRSDITQAKQRYPEYF